MEAKLLHHLTTKPPLPTTLTLSNPSAAARTRHPIFSPTRGRQPLKLGRVRSNGNANDTESESEVAAQQPEITPPPEAVEVRFRRRSSKRQQRDNREGRPARAVPPAKKKWEDMSLVEKAVEVYMGDKGALYWLNKFAYASIFIVIGGWIVFRFVGPALNLYQLDSQPLSPDSIFKGSS